MLFLLVFLFLHSLPIAIPNADFLVVHFVVVLVQLNISSQEKQQRQPFIQILISTRITYKIRETLEENLLLMLPKDVAGHS